jgi:phosphatidylserine/phosphatidylglycerophosphate/cardiolipin synthase-like enzyme
MGFTWPPSDFTLMWVQIGVGFTGALTLVHYFGVLRRKLGHILDIRPFFSPKGGCQEALVNEIKNARREVLVQAYSFTADPLTYALVDAKKRGLDVQILLDKSNELERYSDLKIFLDQGVHPLVDHDHAIAHNKIAIIDQRVVVTGSYNFTNQAEHENAENMLIIRGHAEMIRQYRDNFMKHKSHCKQAQIRESETRDRFHKEVHKEVPKEKAA